MVKTDQFYINGEWVKPQQAAADFGVINPATEQVIESLAMGGGGRCQCCGCCSKNRLCQLLTN